MDMKRCKQFLKIAALNVSLSLLLSLSVSAETEQEKTVTEDLVKKYKVGNIPDSQEEIREHAIPVPRTRMILPSYVDLTSKFPTPGSQGEQGSCTAWAVAYALKTHQENDERYWGVSKPSTQFSPAYIYNQINHGVDDGSSISTALTLLVNEGVCTLADMPYNDEDYITQPTSSQKSKAARYKAKSWYIIGSLDAVKQALVEGNGVVISIPAHDDLYEMDRKNQIYDSLSGEYYGNHAVCVIGYDDSKKAFKFINSWGSRWGVDGYGYVTYDVFVNNKGGRELGYIMDDVVD